MFEAIVIGAIVLLFVGMIYSFIADRRARAEMTEEEWEHRERESSLLGASVMGFDKILRPDLEKAAAVQQDKRHGMMDDEDQAGEMFDSPPVETDSRSGKSDSSE